MQYLKESFKFKMIVYFKQNGRFANNIFQYFASEIIRKIYNYDEVILSNEENCSKMIKIDDELFIKICHFYLYKNEVYSLDTTKNFYLDGYFQRSEILTPFRNYIKRLFTINNHHHINTKYKVSDIVRYINSFQNKVSTSNDLIVHLRLDDFIGHPCQIYKPEQLLKIIDTIKYEKLYIVCDTLRYKWEFEYIQNFKHLNPIFISNSLFEDFTFMMNTPQILISASTFSWLAVYLSDLTNRKIYIPYNNRHGGYFGNGQHLSEFSNECIVFHGLEVIRF